MAQTAEAVEEIEDAPEITEEQRRAARNALNNLIVDLRAQAISQRAASGIEQIWEEDEAAYEANYNQLDEWNSKPPGQAYANKTSSAIGYNITSTYCDTGAATMGDLLFSVDEQPWSIKHTIIPDLVEISKGNVPEDVQRQIQAETENPDEVVSQLVAETKEDVDAATKQAKKVERRITDWLTECQYISHCREILDDCSQVGSGVLKGPFPELRKKIAYVGGKLVVNEKVVPVSRRISYWNAYPDFDAGSNIHQGQFFFERDDITAKELEDLMGSDYLDEEIVACLREGPHKATGAVKGYKSLADMGIVPKKGTYEIWYGYTTLNNESLKNAGFDVSEEERERAHMHVVMVNGRIIKAVENPMTSGAFPYDIMVWKKRKGSPFGKGVAREIRTPQRMIDAGLRALMKNAGIAAGPMLAVLKGLRPLNGKHEIAPLKLWELDPASGVTDITKAFSYFKIDMMVNELEALLNRGLKMAEDVTGLPMLLQGQQGGAPDTVGGMQILQNNATAFRRRIARLFDDLLTTPHIRRYYDFHLQYGPDDEKGDFYVNVKGSSTLVERDIQSQMVGQLAQMFLNPVYGKDPKKASDEYLKALKFNPKTFDYEDEKWQQIVEQMSQPPSDPRVEIQGMKIEHEQAMKKYGEEMENQRLAASQELEIAFRSIEAENEKLKEQGKQELSAAEIMAKMQTAREKIEADLTSDIMKLDTQERLTAMNASAKLSTRPPTEPVGRAANGRSFTQ